MMREDAQQDIAEMRVMTRAKFALGERHFRKAPNTT